MHTGFLKLENAKMSKSLGNVVKLRDALARMDAEALRLFFLSSHYRNELTFSEMGLTDAERRLEYFYETLQRVDERLGLRAVQTSAGTLGETGRFLRAFEQSMDDDFNAAEAQAALHALFTEMNLLLDRPPVTDRDRVLATLAELRAEVRPFGQVLGVFQEAPARWLERRRERLVERRGLDRVHIEKLIQDRSALRQARDWKGADQARDALAALGVELRDGPGGTSWKVRDEP